ncbi:hypothetical protein RRSWK_00758 [Rhodopirellula sp. SWK7]|nr:hypothetical protein RRSWK_00758 [Rhodopirellula sp. SWK7]
MKRSHKNLADSMPLRHLMSGFSQPAFCFRRSLSSADKSQQVSH